MTAPTIGFGLVRPRPRAARASARSIWSAGAPTELPLLFEEALDVFIGRKLDEIVDAFADTDETDRQLQVVGDRNGDASFGGSVQFGEHDAVHTSDGGELP